MEIEVGDWIRSKDGFIGRVRRITYDDMEKSNYYICEKDNVMASNYLENIAKHSKIISEIVEVGDYVNGEEVIEVREQEGKIYLMTGYVPQTYIKEDIKSIVPHEQFASIEYKLEEGK